MFRDRAIVILAISQTLIWAGIFYLFPAALLRWEAGLGWSRTELTLGITLSLFCSALAAPVWGRFIDKGRGAQMIGALSALGGAGVIGLSMMQSLGQYYALCALVGVALSGCLYDAAFALVTRARGATAKRGIVLITLVAGFAGTVSFPAVHLLSEAFGWRGALALIGATVIVLVAPLQYAGVRALGDVPPMRARDIGEKRHLLRGEFWLLGIAFSCAALVQGATLSHLLPLLSERGVALGAAVLAASFIGPMQVLGRLLMMSADRLLSHLGFALLAFALLALSLALLRWGGTDAVLIGAFVVLFGGAYGTVSILRPVLARDILGEAGFGAKAGALAQLYLFGSAGSAYLGALLWRWGGYDAMLTALIGLSGCGAILLWLAQAIRRGN